MLFGGEDESEEIACEGNDHRTENKVDEGEEEFDPEDPAVIVPTRTGAVLGKNTILKSDHFPGCQNMKLRPLVEGAPNFRKVAGLPVYGVAIPTVGGLKTLMQMLGGFTRPILWHNMREEPVLYVKGEPFVLRDVEQPFTNLEYTGIDRVRVEEMERRLKADALAEAAKFGNKILVSGETDDGEVIDIWVQISGPNSIQTSQDVYDQLVEEGFQIDYLRVPMTDEKAPKESVLDMLMRRIIEAPDDAALMFNCQMGRGRTTTGMVIACLICMKTRHPVKQPLPALPAVDRGGLSEGELNLLEGGFPCVRSLTRLLEGGDWAKQMLDEILDRCSAMQNLREAILSYRRYLSSAKDENKKAAAYKRGLEYLERYYVLISYTSYLFETRIEDPKGYMSFEAWWTAHPELDSILQRMLWRNPISALNTPVDKTQDADGDLSVVDARAGAVLSKQTILKEEPYPGIQKRELPVVFSDTPNFRQVPDKPVYGMAIPTRAGIRNTLAHTATAWPGRRVTWVNLREEPVVFVHGKPYVLREAARPFHNLQEYSGITAERVQSMEARIKIDVLAEAALYDGRLQVCRESVDGVVHNEWEENVTNETVLTFPELFADSTLMDGLPGGVPHPAYLRVPITHQRSPKKEDFDLLDSMFRNTEEPLVFVFSCQGGAGRTTTAMVLACLCLDRTLVWEGPGADRGEELRNSLDTTAWSAGGGMPCEQATIMHPGENEQQLSALMRGEYGCVTKLTQVLVGGNAAKMRLDKMINLCGAVENLRSVIVEKRRKVVRECGADEMEQAMKHYTINIGVDLLERYVMLIAYTAWLYSCESANTSFAQWLGNHPEIRQVKKLIRTKPSVALEYDIAPLYHARRASRGESSSRRPSAVAAELLTSSSPSSSRLRSDMRTLSAKKGLLTPNVSMTESHIMHHHHIPAGIYATRVSTAEEQLQLALQRCGSLLSAKSVLYRHKNLESAPVPPARKEVPLEHVGTALYSVAAGTAQGLAHAITELSKDGSQVVLLDLRETPCLYIQDEPYTLGELQLSVRSIRPSCIAGYTLEALEEQLRKDAIAEASANQGRLLLRWQSVEDIDSNAEKCFVPFWKALGDGGVCTPKQTVDRFKEEMKIPLKYRRIPLSSARKVTTADLDCVRAFVQAASADGERGSKYLFLSQRGHGTAGYAMAAAACVLGGEGSGTDELSITPTNTPEASPQGKVDSMVGSPPMRAKNKSSAKLLNWTRGDYRDILGLVRVLNNGPRAKQLADWAIDCCGENGHVRDELSRIKVALEGVTDDRTKDVLMPEALTLIRRYFLLIAFCEYMYMASDPAAHRDKQQVLSGMARTESSTAMAMDTETVGSSVCFICQRPDHIACECPGSFSQWFAQRRELEHLYDHLNVQ